MSFQQVMSKMLSNWDDTSWWREKLSIRRGLLPAYYTLRGNDGMRIVSEDWDNLVILDGCRNDMFETVNTLPGRLEKRRSLASATPTFLLENFPDENYHDIVYVTANTQVNLMLDATNLFHDIVNVWKDGWDEDLRTVPPNVMADAVLEAYEQYPDKRIIAHFIQPHYPFIGPTAREKLPEHRGFEQDREKLNEGSGTPTHEDIWTMSKRGQVSKELVWETYVENLEIALPEVGRLLEQFTGRTVVTSDHGNMNGEFAWPFPVRLYGHFSERILTDELVEVPWLVVEGEERKDVVAEPPRAEQESEPALVKERLRDLGYAT